MNHSLESNITNSMNDTKIQNETVIGIWAIVGSVSPVSVALIAIFSPEIMSVAPWIIRSLSMMGIALGYFSSDRV